jgi:hypothetical protein
VASLTSCLQEYRKRSNIFRVHFLVWCSYFVESFYATFL